MNPQERIKIGISACLLGHKVRFDSGHKRAEYVTDQLAEYFDFAPVCPEVAIGLGTPRQPIRLVAVGKEIRARGSRDASLDVTGALADYGRKMAVSLADISGYIVKKDSPSCGLERVKVYTERPNTPAQRTGSGIYTRAFLDSNPLIPVEEEGRLNDAVLRENFIERVFTYHRWQMWKREGVTPARLVQFHTEHKYIVMSRGRDASIELGRMIAQAGKSDPVELAARYIAQLMLVLQTPASRKRHTTVLMHLMGSFKTQLDGADKNELLKLIEEYRIGRLPLILPLTMLRHYLRRFPNAYVHGQRYLEPYPDALMLRNAI